MWNKVNIVQKYECGTRTNELKYTCVVSHQTKRTKNDGRSVDKSCILKFWEELSPALLLPIKMLISNRICTYLCNIPAVKAVNETNIRLDNTKRIMQTNPINIDDLSTDTIEEIIAHTK